MKPSKNYTIWFTQRNWSTYLCDLLRLSWVAWNPWEHIDCAWDSSLSEVYWSTVWEKVLQNMYKAWIWDNWVFGIKANAPRKENDKHMNEFRSLLWMTEASNIDIWQKIFPNSQHLFITRRNKVRQAVSRRRAIKSWLRHKTSGWNELPENFVDEYDYSAIHHLLQETVMREAKIQEFLTEMQVWAYQIVYEDFVLDPTSTIQNVLTYLWLEAKVDDYSFISTSEHRKIADDIAEIWVEKYRKEAQQSRDTIIR